MSRLHSKGVRPNSLFLQRGSIHNLSILIILVCCFIVLVSALTWFALGRVQESLRADVSDALQIVLQTTRESLNLWVDSNKFQLSRLAGDPRLVSLTERQLRVPRNRSALLESEALPELRAFFREWRNQFGEAGFFIISSNFLNIASMRDENIGTKNLIANQALDLLQRAFRGESLMVPPIWSDIPLIAGTDSRSRMSPSMFFAAPVKNRQGDVIAVVTQRIDPSRDFTRLIQLGRIGESGETYAFGPYGKLLSESRFNRDLRKAGLLQEGEKSILRVSARDPGGDTTKGYIPAVPRYQQPLTLMAQQATKGKSGINVDGYRDYRGVPVYGVWIWDEALGMGLATKIDESDALKPYYTTRKVIITVLAITVLLALCSLLFTVLIEVRANRALQKSHAELESRVEERTAELNENQARLMESEERFRGYFEHSQVGMAVTAPDKGWIEVNGQLQQMLGYNLDELRQMTWDNLTHPDDLAADLKNFEQMLAGEIDDYTMDKRFIRKDGGVVYANFTVTCVRRPDGSVQNVLASMLDITERKQAEQALLESRAAARGLLDATQESLLLLDKEGTIIAVNQTAARRLQQKPAELIGTHHVDNLPENVIESRKAHFQKVLQTGNPVDFEDVRDGIVFHNIYYPLRDKDDVIMGGAIFAHDITERKRAEEALKESEINMRAIFENSPLGMIHFSKDGTILDCNDQFVELMGSSREKLIGFNTPKQTTDEKLRAAIIKALAGETAEYEGDYTSTTGNKTTSLRIVFNPTEPGTSPTEVIATLEDITERKQAEEAIRKSKERLNTILKTTAQGFWLNDEDDNLMEVNEAMCEILGLSKEKIVGSNFFDFLDEKNREVVREQNRMRKKGIRSMYEISLIRSDGQQVPCLMNASPLLDADGNVIGSFGMTTNIAERKQMEEELRKNVDELERFSKVAFGREKKMIQLKQEINELMIQLGQNEKYKIVQ